MDLGNLRTPTRFMTLSESATTDCWWSIPPFIPENSVAKEELSNRRLDCSPSPGKGNRRLMGDHVLKEQTIDYVIYPIFGTNRGR